MKKLNTENSIVIVLFIFVLVIFSFAEKDSKNLDKLYKKTSVKQPEPDKKVVLASKISSIK